MAISRKGIKWRKPKTGKIISCLVCGNKKYYYLSNLKRGNGKFCSQSCAGKYNKIGIVFSREHKENISKNHHNVSGKNNPNWKNGISNKQVKYRNKNWKKFQVWRELVLRRDKFKCKNCGNNKKLHVHPIIARKTLQSAEFIRANGITLCENCHRKTDSWGGGIDKISYNRKGNLIHFIMKVIPHCWQDYNTVGNYFFTKDGTIVIFCSDLKNNKYHNLVFSHEMFESVLVKDRDIKDLEIVKFDIAFKGKGEPGNFPKSPYHKEHLFATKIEKLLAKELDVSWKKYSDTINNL